MTAPSPNPERLRFLSAYAGRMVVPKRRSGARCPQTLEPRPDRDLVIPLVERENGEGL